MIANVNVMVHHQAVKRSVIRNLIGVVVVIAEMTVSVTIVSVMSVPATIVSAMIVCVTIVPVMIASVTQVQAGPGDGMTATEKGLVMRDHLGGGPGTKMVPRDVTWTVEEWMTVVPGGGMTVTVLP